MNWYKDTCIVENCDEGQAYNPKHGTHEHLCATRASIYKPSLSSSIGSQQVQICHICAKTPVAQGGWFGQDVFAKSVSKHASLDFEQI